MSTAQQAGDHRAHALGEVPHRQPLLEQRGPIGHQEIDAVAAQIVAEVTKKTGGSLRG